MKDLELCLFILGLGSLLQEVLDTRSTKRNFQLCEELEYS